MNESLKFSDKALEINYYFADAQNNKGLIYFGLNQSKSDKSIKFFDKELELDSQFIVRIKIKKL